MIDSFSRVVTNHWVENGACYESIVHLNIHSIKYPTSITMFGMEETSAESLTLFHTQLNSYNSVHRLSSIYKIWIEIYNNVFRILLVVNTNYLQTNSLQ